MKNYLTEHHTGRMLCIDPGPKNSGIAYLKDGLLSGSNQAVDNEELHCILTGLWNRKNTVCMEELESYNLRAGQATFKSVFWSGRFFEAFNGEVKLITRKQVRIFMLGSLKIKNTDAKIRDAVLTLFEASGGGRWPEIGIKSKPGPLYGLTGHAVQALAVGITLIGLESGMCRVSDFRQRRIF